MTILGKIKNTLGRDQYIQNLFDPIQTHAVYGVYADQVPALKQRLKDLGCNRFRVVSSSGKGLKIVCFKIPENK